MYIILIESCIEELTGTIPLDNKNTLLFFVAETFFGTTYQCDSCATSALRSSDREYQSAIAKHLSLNVECTKLYSDDCFSVRTRSRKHLEVLKSVYIHVQRPVLCVQKQFVTLLHLFRSRLAPVST